MKKTRGKKRGKEWTSHWECVVCLCVYLCVCVCVCCMHVVCCYQEEPFRSLSFSLSFFPFFFRLLFFSDFFLFFWPSAMAVNCDLKLSWFTKSLSFPLFFICPAALLMFAGVFGIWKSCFSCCTAFRNHLLDNTNGVLEPREDLGWKSGENICDFGWFERYNFILNNKTPHNFLSFLT